ncbi:Dynein, intermediate chain, flagellar outer arm [Portunus trituberculatus]|uniref:Dynein, intermediate chain, flagellar outer arm n=1 Tax=Portunus trituberculatus TaxID=210409 RepID=A0A5B7D0U9_PORTR|nr:Dynein, intermediate chain, flagellar outer arm [Portunus trituberculatus]
MTRGSKAARGRVMGGSISGGGLLKSFSMKLLDTNRWQHHRCPPNFNPHHNFLLVYSLSSSNHISLYQFGTGTSVGLSFDHSFCCHCSDFPLTYKKSILDFRYWEDGSDEFRPLEGSLLPLWKFTHDGSRHLIVTDVCWSPIYSDLFAAAYAPAVCSVTSQRK